MINIPSDGKVHKNLVLKVNLHNSAQRGDILFDEIFFNGLSKKDFFRCEIL